MVRIRDPKDVARRALILQVVAARGHGIDRDTLIDRLKTTGLWSYVSPNEKTLFEQDDPPERDLTRATWRAEALWTLLWSIGKIPNLGFPDNCCDVDLIHEIMPSRGEIEEFINSTDLQPTSAILDETDKIYRIHWAVRDEGLKGNPPPANLNPGVVMERHFYLNWLTYYADEWDEVTTDT